MSFPPIAEVPINAATFLVRGLEYVNVILNMLIYHVRHGKDGLTLQPTKWWEIKLALIKLDCFCKESYNLTKNCVNKHHVIGMHSLKLCCSLQFAHWQIGEQRTL